MRGRIWSPEHTTTLKRMAAAGYTDREIADHLGRDRPFICRKRAALRIERGVSAAMIAALARINMRRRMAA